MHVGYIGMGAPSALPDAPLLYDSREWDGGLILPNIGYAGHAYDIDVDIGWGAWKTISLGAGFWSEIGGDPGTVPITVIFAFGTFYDGVAGQFQVWGPDGGGASAMGGWLGQDGGYDSNVYVGSGWYPVENWHGGQIWSDLAFPINSLVTTELNATVGTIINRVDDANLPPDPGGYYSENNGPQGSYVSSIWASPLDVDLTMSGYPLGSPGDPWAGLLGMAVVRSALTNADRAMWHSYFYG